MQNRNKIRTEKDLVENLKRLAESYEEISVMQMQRVRGSVLKTRNFLADLSEVYGNVKTSYRKQIELLAKRKGNVNIKSFSTVAKNGKHVMVLISANNKLYGNIIFKVFNEFMSDLSNSSADIVIVGKLGKDLFEQRKTQRPFTYFDIPDSGVSADELRNLISHIIHYEKVTVFYGQFVNVIHQDAEANVITGETQEDIAEKTPTKFYFEPSLEEVLAFFETQIFTSLFKQTLQETQLARYASRINAMENALENIGTRTKLLSQEEKQLKSAIENKKMQETLAGISIWGRK